LGRDVTPDPTKEDKVRFGAGSYLQRRLRTLLVAGLAPFVVAPAYAQGSGSSDVAALKAQMGKVQKQFDDRISTIESRDAVLRVQNGFPVDIEYLRSVG
jgi:hypothetical protein